jgi:hypothetical protein|tara:strand:- start:678 stop:878 length:201 start_codon:yes stop_codon:yes gene_type:complete
MILIDVDVVESEDDESVSVLLFEFSENHLLTFECPTGLEAMDALQAFREFIETAEDIIKAQTTSLH